MKETTTFDSTGLVNLSIGVIKQALKDYGKLYKHLLFLESCNLEHTEIYRNNVFKLKTIVDDFKNGNLDIYFGMCNIKTEPVEYLRMYKQGKGLHGLNKFDNL